MMPRMLCLIPGIALTLLASNAAAQPAPAPPAKSTVTALMVEVTISRFQGDKRISNLPYTLAVAPDNSRATLRVGGDVAIPSAIAKEPAEGKPTTSYSYRPIGTNIDAQATPADDGRFKVSISIEESSVYPPGEAAKGMNTVAGAPAFRSLRSSNTLTLRDGQSVEYVAATDRISGETARISVKLTVVN